MNMNHIKIKHFSYIFIASIVLIIFIFPFKIKSKNADVIGYCVEPQRVYTLAISDKLEFAGDDIPFVRFDVRENLDRELLAFTYMHSTTLMLIKRANLYFPIIEPILKEYGVPDDFKYLALIESYFNPRSVSPAKAAGIWQFMEETAKKYGLEVNEQIDERLDIRKSTEAACKYLSESYELYGDWVIVAASYNGGRGRLTRELERQKTSSFFDLYLNEETTRYVYRIIAAKEVIAHPAKYGFCLNKQDFYHTVRTNEIEVHTSVENWADWAKERGTTYGQLKYFNPWIQDIKLDNKKEKTYKVKVPYPEDLNFDIKKVNIYNESWIKYE